MALFVVCASMMLSTVLGTPLDDYVNKVDPNYKWFDTHQTFKTQLGGEAHVLNVTSQKWLDISRAAGPAGDLWQHMVVVVVPKELKYKNMSVAYLTGNCNDNVKPPSKDDEELLLVDTIAHDASMIGIIVYQLPNCPIIYPTDPSQKHRTEDAMIAWAWNSFINLDPTHDPEWLPRLPMVKGAMASMKAVEEFTSATGLATLDGWFVAGASKRGWTTWMVGAVECPTCPNIVGIAPLVPIVPSLHAEIHRMYQAYGGYTFAFKDYEDGLNLTAHLDDPAFKLMTDIVDPINYLDRLKRLPKMPVLSSDDEFMMMDWTNIWYDEFIADGETHLLIAPNSEHSLATGIPEVVESMGAMISSLAEGHTREERPSFTFERDNATGTIVVTVADGHYPTEVTLRHSQTLQTKRRDFRWVRLASPEAGNCTLPDIPLKKPIFGANCLVPIVWYTDVIEKQNGVYTATPPKPKDGHWVGYFVELKFLSGTKAISKFHFSTPGYTFPDTLPFPDCHGAQCAGTLV